MDNEEKVAILDIIQALRSTNSKLEKLRILNENGDYIPWLDYLVDVYDPFVTYGVSGNKNDLQDDLHNLQLCRSVNAGITAVSINKAYPNLIPSASKMMKAYDYGKKARPIPDEGGFWVGVKYDGNYVNIVCSEAGGVQFYTSGGHQYTHEVKLNLREGYVYTAERIHGEGKLGDRRRCSLEGPKGAKFAKIDNHYKIFDVVTIGDFNCDLAIEDYETRRTLIPPEYAGTERWCETLEEAEAWLDELIRLGYEGIMIKLGSLRWRNSKSRKVDCIKWKKRLTADLYCIEELEGVGNSQGIIGSIRLRDAAGLEFSVGSGLSLNGDLPFGSYINNVVEIGYEHINPEGTYVQPVVLGIRHDKSKNDID